MKKGPKISWNEIPTNTWTPPIDSTELDISEGVINILDNNNAKITYNLELKKIHAKNELSEKQYDAIERYLDYDGMTIEKITLLKNLSPEMIKNWAGIFTNMTYSGLNDLIIVNNNSKKWNN